MKGICINRQVSNKWKISDVLGLDYVSLPRFSPSRFQITNMWASWCINPFCFHSFPAKLFTFYLDSLPILRSARMIRDLLR